MEVPRWKKSSPNENTEFKNKWSGSNEGGGEGRSGGGWSREAFKCYNKMIHMIQKTRADEMNDGQERFQKALDLLQELHKKKRKQTPEQEMPELKKPRKETTSTDVIIVTIDE